MLMKIVINNESILLANNTIYLKGFCFYKNKLIDSIELLHFLEKINDIHLVNNFANLLTGQFNILYKTRSGELVVINDITNSHILYFCIKNELTITDDASFFLKEEISINNEQLKAFKGFSYSLGENTLINEINIFKTGCVYFFNNNRFSCFPYFQFHTNKSIEECDTISKMIFAYKNAVSRLIRFANGRQIVVPLSSGFDSRLVCSLLNEQKYENVLTYTYSASLDGEASIAKLIAEHYHYDWNFVQYSTKSLRKLYKSKYFLPLALNLGGFFSAPIIQEWYAIEFLTSQKLLQENCIFVPGHSCSSIYELLSSNNTCKDEYSSEEIVDFIYNIHCIFSKKDSDLLKRLIKKQLVKNKYTKEDAYSELINFNYRERQTKCISNSAKIFEYYGYCYYLLLWDSEIVYSWNNLDISHSLSRNIYKSLLIKMCPSLMSALNFYDSKKEIANKEKRAKTFVKKILPLPFKILKTYFSIKKQKKDLNLWGYSDFFDTFISIIKSQPLVDYVWIRKYLFFMKKRIKIYENSNNSRC